ncbi:MAG: hypothetical protein AAB466_01790 [Verrucomicrobiota bacterium]
MHETASMLQRPEYLHVVLNHLPVIGLAVAVVALVLALLSKSRGAVLGALVLVALVAASAWPVIQSGESAYNRLRAISDPDGASLLKQHMLLADRWAWLYYLTALTAAAGAVLACRRPEKLRVAGIPVVVLALASLMAGAAIAKLGGEVRHPEFRPGSALVPQGIPAGHNHEHEPEH